MSVSNKGLVDKFNSGALKRPRPHPNPDELTSDELLAFNALNSVSEEYQKQYDQGFFRGLIVGISIGLAAILLYAVFI